MHGGWVGPRSRKIPRAAEQEKPVRPGATLCSERSLAPRQRVAPTQHNPREPTGSNKDPAQPQNTKKFKSNLRQKSP